MKPETEYIAIPAEVAVPLGLYCEGCAHIFSDSHDGFAYRCSVWKCPLTNMNGRIFKYKECAHAVFAKLNEPMRTEGE